MLGAVCTHQKQHIVFIDHNVILSVNLSLLEPFKLIIILIWRKNDKLRKNTQTRTYNIIYTLKYTLVCTLYMPLHLYRRGKRRKKNKNTVNGINMIHKGSETEEHSLCITCLKGSSKITVCLYFLVKCLLVISTLQFLQIWLNIGHAISYTDARVQVKFYESNEPETSQHIASPKQIHKCSFLYI